MISIVYSTRNSSPSYKDHLTQTAGLENIEILETVNNNQYSLAEVYNDGLKNAKNDIIIFMHDDLILSQNFAKKIKKYFEYNSEYGILGLAGTTNLPKSGTWWEANNQMIGRVWHQHEGKKWESTYSEKYNKLILSAAIIDGLFIAVDRTKIKANFDESIGGFHFYDVAFSVRNYIEGVKIGIVTDIPVTHLSIGQTSQSWEDNKKLFLEKYQEHLPINHVPEIHVPEIKSSFKKKPKVAIIIPTKNNFELLKNNINSVNHYSEYSNIKFYIADTGSDEECLAKTKEYLTTIPNSELIQYDYYNFAKINNDVVNHYVEPDTELLLFSNDDIQIMNDTISSMVKTYLNNKKNVGTIGCRLYYENKSIQHAGILLVFSKSKNEIFLTHKGINTYYQAAYHTQKQILGSTGAYLMINKTLFKKIGGFDENTTECFEDVLLNMECIKRKKTNIYVGEATAFHFESITRNRDADKLVRQSNDFKNILLPYINKNKHIVAPYIIAMP
jgi:GT2 family glycosyltransferase